MLKTKVAVGISGSGTLPDDAILLGESYVRLWKIPKGQHVQLKFGAFRQHVKVIPSSRLEGMRISDALAAKLGLPFEGTASRVHLRMHFRAVTGTLSLGPLIGVLISRDDPAAPDRPFGSITLFCRELTEACKAQGASVFFFTPGGIGDDGDIVQGWHYAGGWKKVSLPTPDIVNNRLTSRKLENSPAVQRYFANARQKHSTVVFNEKFLDKTEVFDALKEDKGLARYLPESHLLSNYAVFKGMCNRHAHIFLKPVRGSLGKGIIRISHMEGESYQALHATPSGARKQIYPSLSKLYGAISLKMKTVRYQIQQGLQLIEIGRRPADFRALVQKNAAGEWVITSIVARTAGNQHFVSNLARGGTLSTVSEAIAKSNITSSIGRQGAAQRLKQAALAIAGGIDNRISAHFGELGIDLAIDTSGRVWLLEVNSKPSKNDNTPLTEGKIRPSVRLMIQYARFLSGF